MLQTAINWLVITNRALGYPGIFFLMAMESSVIPIPSELVMPFAGYLAQQGEMNLFVAIFCGTAGSLLGAYLNYFAAHYLGRPLLLRYGKYVWITEEKFAKVETFFHKHGEISTFIGRLLPVVRHLIS
ncbi:MAG TPA: DedA family protein, partial [Geobacteraceae bacterium]|nr:DedA family protein [Geobacteraceae bacterium]